jgi:hypothetical protein
LALLALLALIAVIAAGLWLRSRDRVEIEGKLREGSLRCDDECHFELVLEGQPETRVRVETCIMPEALRDWPGTPVHVMAAGRWQGERQLLATALLTREGLSREGKSSPSPGRPPSCFVPARR